MTIDEAITHAREVAEEQRDKCEKCAEDHEQLVKWLEELKVLREGKVDVIDEFADWLVEQGILGNRVISDGEITDYGKVYAKKFKEQKI